MRCTTGNVGIIGWYVPGWMAEEHPDILDYKNLNKYADLFKTSESGDLASSSAATRRTSSTTRRSSRTSTSTSRSIFSGSEAATIKAFQQAVAEKKPLLGYFWDPQWLHSQVKLDRVKLPPFTEGCDADPRRSPATTRRRR